MSHLFSECEPCALPQLTRQFGGASRVGYRHPPLVVHLGYPLRENCREEHATNMRPSWSSSFCCLNPTTMHSAASRGARTLCTLPRLFPIAHPHNAGAVPRVYTGVHHCGGSAGRQVHACQPNISTTGSLTQQIGLVWSCRHRTPLRGVQLPGPSVGRGLRTSRVFWSLLALEAVWPLTMGGEA